MIWELFEFGAQPHRHLSDEEVLTFVIRERQITLAQPRLKLTHADYWSVFLLVYLLDYFHAWIMKKSLFYVVFLLVLEILKIHILYK